ncbi:MAG: hypothetical protein IT537_08165 [Hyphomicrobiales bacterium]|nr:hypothetical protein [Hyphomicrobiales bacterium]
MGSLALAQGAERYPVAGVTPDQRPGGAPVIRELVKPAGWEQRFTRGIEGPLPAGLRWIADQGAWFTPFDRPGAPGPYDLRGWHRGKGKGQ